MTTGPSRSDESNLSSEEIEQVRICFKEILVTLADGGDALGKSAEQVAALREEAPIIVDMLCDMALRSLASSENGRYERLRKLIDRRIRDLGRTHPRDRDDEHSGLVDLMATFEDAEQKLTASRERPQIK